MKKLFATIFFLFSCYAIYSAEIIDLKDLGVGSDEIINPAIVQGPQYNALKLPKKFLQLIALQGKLADFYVMYDGKLTQLKLVPHLILDLSYLKLSKEDFDDISFEGMHNIKQLILEGNFFDKLPTTFCELTGLERLDLTFNIYLKKLPKDLDKLINLKTLNCCLCISLNTLPQCMHKLKQLNELNLEYTPVAHHPDSFDTTEISLTQLYIKPLGIEHSKERMQVLSDLFENTNVIFSDSPYIKNSVFLKCIALFISIHGFSKQKLSKLWDVLSQWTPLIVPWGLSGLLLLRHNSLPDFYFQTYHS